MTDEEFMRVAVEEAGAALASKDVPVGALVVKDGKIIARAHNEKELRQDPSAHAEVLAIQRAAQALGTWYLDDCTLYVTLEPCVMCAGAIINSRIKRLVFGAYDFRFGCCGTLYNLPTDTRFNHRAEVEGGILADECAQMLKDFFKKLRE